MYEGRAQKIAFRVSKAWRNLKEKHFRFPLTFVVHAADVKIFFGFSHFFTKIE